MQVLGRVFCVFPLVVWRKDKVQWVSLLTLGAMGCGRNAQSLCTEWMTKVPESHGSDSHGGDILNVIVPEP